MVRTPPTDISYIRLGSGTALPLGVVIKNLIPPLPGTTSEGYAATTAILEIYPPDAVPVATTYKWIPNTGFPTTGIFHGDIVVIRTKCLRDAGRDIRSFRVGIRQCEGV